MARKSSAFAPDGAIGRHGEVSLRGPGIRPVLAHLVKFPAHLSSSDGFRAVFRGFLLPGAGGFPRLT